MIILKGNIEKGDIQFGGKDQPSLIPLIQREIWRIGINEDSYTRFVFSKKEIDLLWKAYRDIFHIEKENAIQEICTLLRIVVIPSLLKDIQKWNQRARVYSEIIQYKKRECIAITFTIYKEKDSWDPDWDD